MPGTSHKTALRRFQGYQGGCAGFRRVQRSVNGLLMGSWCVVSRAVAAVFGKATERGTPNGEGCYV
jgi:hypothetical protein